MAVMLRFAQEEDNEVIVRLLQQAQMNASGVDKPSTRFLIAEKAIAGSERREIVGTAGVEFYGQRALLRSFVLADGGKHGRIGLEIMRVLLAFVEQQDVHELYLIAPAPSAFFYGLGFSAIGWEALPVDIRQCQHLRQADREATPMIHRVVHAG